MIELRLTRALERVEKLKDSGKWSFRQVRRTRGVGHLAKTHWDHLIDEMVSGYQLL
jgi:chromatin modification-related protein VID21